jgi:hypothetical protein
VKEAILSIRKVRQWLTFMLLPLLYSLPFVRRTATIMEGFPYRRLAPITGLAGDAASWVAWRSRNTAAPEIFDAVEPAPRLTAEG